MKREVWLDYLRVTACFMVMVGLVSVLLQRIPRAGKWLVG